MRRFGIGYDYDTCVAQLAIMSMHPVYTISQLNEAATTQTMSISSIPTKPDDHIKRILGLLHHFSDPPITRINAPTHRSFTSDTLTQIQTMQIPQG
jgi:hypothetical protein